MSTLQQLEDKYFNKTGANVGAIFSQDTEVKYLVDGASYFAAIHEKVGKCTGAGDLIYILGWRFDASMRLPNPRDAGNPTLAQLLADKAALGVDVRTILWANVYARGLEAMAWQESWDLRERITVLGVEIMRTNLAQIVKKNMEDARSLRKQLPSSGGQPPLTDRVLLDWSGDKIGSHHEKVVLVKAGEQMWAYVGGIDFWWAHWDEPQHQLLERTMEDGSKVRWGWHYAAVELSGKAVDSVLAHFRFRWANCADLPPQRVRIGFFKPDEVFNPKIVPLPPSVVPAASVTTSGRSIQLLRSFQNILVDRWGARVLMPSHPNPIEETPATLIQAIKAAKRYIYVEDQYFAVAGRMARKTNNDGEILLPHLLDAAKLDVKIIFLAPGEADPDDQNHKPINTALNEAVKEEVVDKLDANKKKNIAFYRVNYLTVHSKVWLIDDEFAMIGSANFFDRAMMGIDSELSVAIVDAGPPASNLVCNLRLALWAEHLRVNANDAQLRPALLNLDQSLGIWRAEWGPDPSMWRTPGNPPGFAPAETVLVLLDPP